MSNINCMGCVGTGGVAVVTLAVDRGVSGSRPCTATKILFFSWVGVRD